MTTDNACVRRRGKVGRIGPPATVALMRFRHYLLAIASIALSACSAPGTYPLSGEVCGPEDPVKDMQGCDFSVLNLLPSAWSRDPTSRTD